MISEKIKNQIINALDPVEPYKVILFGSHARGDADEESDIDLYVVTNDNFMPKNWSEKMDVKLKVSRALKNLRKQYDIDLIVHTREMSKLFFQSNGQMAREMKEKGIRIK